MVDIEFSTFQFLNGFSLTEGAIDADGIVVDFQFLNGFSLARIGPGAEAAKSFQFLNGFSPHYYGRIEIFTPNIFQFLNGFSLDQTDADLILTIVNPTFNSLTDSHKEIKNKVDEENLTFQFLNGFSPNCRLLRFVPSARPFNSLTDSHTNNNRKSSLCLLTTFNSLTDSHSSHCIVCYCLRNFQFLNGFSLPCPACKRIVAKLAFQFLNGFSLSVKSIAADASEIFLSIP